MPEAQKKQALSDHVSLPIIQRDPYLKPYEHAIEGRYRHAIDTEREVAQ